MMNGRHALPCGMSAHESGSTIRKKIVKVAVGKSTASGQLGASVAGDSCGCPAQAGRATYSIAGGGRRVMVLSLSLATSRAVRSAGGASQDGSSGRVAGGVLGEKAPYARSR